MNDAARRAGLETAFQATAYCVDTELGRFALHIGEKHPAFDRFLAAHGARQWAVVTACNPGARQSNEAANADGRRRLSALARAKGWDYRPACNRADRLDGEDWPAEPGLLLLGVSVEQACAIARRFGQLACVCGITGGVPELVWIA